MKKNCWEFKNCGKQSGSKHSGEKGECITASMSMYDGINGGRNGGRVCWMIAGTVCDDERQDTFSHKVESCAKCDFYEAIREEEGANLDIPLEIVENILDRIK